MIPIRHILNETGVSQIFKLIVPSGNYQGEYVIKTPLGWNEIDSIVRMNADTFNVEEFIIGKNEKLTFPEFTDKKAYDLIKSVYREQRGDGRIIFKWFAEKNGIQYDMLSETFEINLNKYSHLPDKTKMKIEVELKLNEDQNKLLTRYETTVNLFEEKDLDEKPLDPVDKFEVGFKKNNSTLKNLYIYNTSQDGYLPGYNTQGQKTAFFAFVRADGYEFGDNTNQDAGSISRINHSDPVDPGYQDYLGPFITTNIKTNVKVQFQSLLFQSNEECKLFAIVYSDGFERKVLIQSSQYISGKHEIRIDYNIYTIDNINGGQSLTFRVEANDGNLDSLRVIDDTTIIEITEEIETPLVHTSSIRLLSAANQLVKNYTSSAMMAESNIIGPGGLFYNTSISTGIYLRGLPALYGGQKIKTSLNALLNEGAFKLMALGFDVIGNKMIIEDVGYFFKDIMCYDLSEKQYLTDSYKLENDSDLSFNALSFGTKKYSTNQKFDIQNFNTIIELSTPIKSNKKKFDQQTDLIIDADKIKELTDDSSNATNDSDDDLVLIDMVALSNYEDSGVFEDCQHINAGGQKILRCYNPSFDASMIKVGQQITIPEGLNAGMYTVAEIVGSDMKIVGGSGSFQTGNTNTKIVYRIDTLVKNRTDEGFNIPGGLIRNPTSTTNIRHNPKYQLARWWPYFGSGLRAKGPEEKLKVTSYKNNSAAKMEITAQDMANELQGEVTVGDNETLGRMRNFRQTFFNGDKIQISYSKVTYEEFFHLFNNWKFGIDGDRNKNRGYIPCNTPDGILEVYPAGDEIFRHSKQTNTLTIVGKVRGKAIENPILISAVQVNSNTVALTWDYVIDFVNPEIKLQYSFDGAYWQNIHTVNNVKESTFSDPAFGQILTGTTVYFRVIVSSADYYNKVSNSRPVTWQFNNWIIREYQKNENTNCGYSYLGLEIRGTAELEIKWMYEDNPGGGNYTAIDIDDNSVISSYNSPYGFGQYNESTTDHSLDNATKYFNIQLKNSDKNEFEQVLNCTSGNVTAPVYAGLTIEAKDNNTGETRTFNLDANTVKKYRQRPTQPIGTTDPF